MEHAAWVQWVLSGQAKGTGLSLGADWPSTLLRLLTKTGLLSTRSSTPRSSSKRGRSKRQQAGTHKQSGSLATTTLGTISCTPPQAEPHYTTSARSGMRGGQRTCQPRTTYGQSNQQAQAQRRVFAGLECISYNVERQYQHLKGSRVKHSDTGVKAPPNAASITARDWCGPLPLPLPPLPPDIMPSSCAGVEYVDYDEVKAAATLPSLYGRGMPRAEAGSHEDQDTPPLSTPLAPAAASHPIPAASSSQQRTSFIFTSASRRAAKYGSSRFRKQRAQVMHHYAVLQADAEGSTGGDTHQARVLSMCSPLPSSLLDHYESCVADTAVVALSAPQDAAEEEGSQLLPHDIPSSIDSIDFPSDIPDDAAVIPLPQKHQPPVSPASAVAQEAGQLDITEAPCHDDHAGQTTGDTQPHGTDVGVQCALCQSAEVRTTYSKDSGAYCDRVMSGWQLHRAHQEASQQHQGREALHITTPNNGSTEFCERCMYEGHVLLDTTEAGTGDEEDEEEGGSGTDGEDWGPCLLDERHEDYGMQAGPGEVSDWLMGGIKDEGRLIAASEPHMTLQECRWTEAWRKINTAAGAAVLGVHGDPTCGAFDTAMQLPVGRQCSVVTPQQMGDMSLPLAQKSLSRAYSHASERLSAEHLLDPVALQLSRIFSHSVDRQDSTNMKSCYSPFMDPACVIPDDDTTPVATSSPSFCRDSSDTPDWSSHWCDSYADSWGAGGTPRCDSSGFPSSSPLLLSDDVEPEDTQRRLPWDCSSTPHASVSSPSAAAAGLHSVSAEAGVLEAERKEGLMRWEGIQCGLVKMMVVKYLQGSTSEA